MKRKDVRKQNKQLCPKGMQYPPLPPSNCLSYCLHFIAPPDTYYGGHVVFPCSLRACLHWLSSIFHEVSDLVSLIHWGIPRVSLEQFLLYNWLTIHICWINEWMNKQISLGRRRSSRMLWMRNSKGLLWPMKVAPMSASHPEPLTSLLWFHHLQAIFHINLPIIIFLQMRT